MPEKKLKRLQNFKGMPSLFKRTNPLDPVRNLSAFFLHKSPAHRLTAMKASDILRLYANICTHYKYVNKFTFLPVSKGIDVSEGSKCVAQLLPKGPLLAQVLHRVQRQVEGAVEQVRECQVDNEPGGAIAGVSEAKSGKRK